MHYIGNNKILDNKTIIILVYILYYMYTKIKAYGFNFLSIFKIDL